MASLKRRTNNTIANLLNNLGSAVKIFLMVIVSGNIIILFHGEGVPFFSYDNAAYAHFFGGKMVNVDEYQVVFLLSPSSPVARENSTPY
jgi:hypothetical protein